MRTFLVLVVAGVFMGVSLQVSAEPQRRYNTITFENASADNPQFAFRQELGSCARSVGPQNFTIVQGWNPHYRYYERLFERDCMYETKELHWLVTASRPQDGLDRQCRMKLTRRFDRASGWFITRIDVEAAKPVAQGAADLCTNGTLFKSATCEVSDVQAFGRDDCLNRDSDHHGKITVVLGGPPLPPAPQSERINPLIEGSSR